MARLELMLLGGFQARLVPGGAIDLPTRKAQALLAYLALPAGRAHPRDRALGVLGAIALRRVPAATGEAMTRLGEAIAVARQLGMRPLEARGVAAIDQTHLLGGRDAVTADAEPPPARRGESS